MSKCSGDCGSCSSSGTTTPTSGKHVTPPRDIKTFLAPLPKEKSDPTPLNRPCMCDQSRRYQRYQCLPCIRSWVQAACPCKIEDALDYYKKSGIVIDRIKQCVEEKKRKARINANGYIDDGCGDCTCQSDR